MQWKRTFAKTALSPLFQMAVVLTTGLGGGLGGAMLGGDGFDDAPVAENIENAAIIKYRNRLQDLKNLQDSPTVYKKEAEDIAQDIIIDYRLGERAVLELSRHYPGSMQDYAVSSGQAHLIKECRTDYALLRTTPDPTVWIKNCAAGNETNHEMGVLFSGGASAILSGAMAHFFFIGLAGLFPLREWEGQPKITRRFGVN